jgi:hypothetical protein
MTPRKLDELRRRGAILARRVEKVRREEKARTWRRSGVWKLL